MSELNFEPAATIETSAPETEAPKKKGRPKGKKNAPKTPAPEQAAPKSSAINDPFEQLKKDIEENERNNINPAAAAAPAVEAPPAVNLLSGYILLLAMDLIFPSGIKMIFKKAAKDIPLSQIRMTKDQKDSLEPLADEVAKRIQQYLDPITLFFIAAGGMYYINFTEAIEKAKPKEVK
jgi:hypothetical protein